MTSQRSISGDVELIRWIICNHAKEKNTHIWKRTNRYTHLYYTHIYIFTHTPIYTHRHTNLYIHTFIYSHTLIYTHRHAFIHTLTQTKRWNCERENPNVYMHTHYLSQTHNRQTNLFLTSPFNSLSERKRISNTIYKCEKRDFKREKKSLSCLVCPTMSCDGWLVCCNTAKITLF